MPVIRVSISFLFRMRSARCWSSLIGTCSPLRFQVSVRNKDGVRKAAIFCPPLSACPLPLKGGEGNEEQAERARIFNMHRGGWICRTLQALDGDASSLAGLGDALLVR